MYHQHPETVWRYAWRKMQLGRWKIAVLVRHPAKALRDSYTPWTQKFQIALVPIFAGGLLAAALELVPWPALGWIATLGLLSCLPLTVRAAGLGLQVASIAPAMIAIRAVALALGLAWGLFEQLVTKDGQTIL